MTAWPRGPIRLLSKDAFIAEIQQRWNLIMPSRHVPMLHLSPQVYGALLGCTVAALRYIATERTAVEPALAIQRKHLRVRSLQMIYHLFPPITAAFSLAKMCWVAQHPGVDFEGHLPMHWPSCQQFQDCMLCIARAIISHLLQRAPPVDIHVQRCMMWNVASLKDLGTTVAQRKLRVISGHLQHGPVFLLETKADPTWESRMMTSFGSARITSTLGATLLESTGEAAARPRYSSGGVAILVPTHRFPDIGATRVLVPGYAVAMTVLASGRETHLIAAYFRPKQELDILKLLDQSLGAWANQGNIV